MKSLLHITLAAGTSQGPMMHPCVLQPRVNPLVKVNLSYEAVYIQRQLKLLYITHDRSHMREGSLHQMETLLSGCGNALWAYGRPATTQTGQTLCKHVAAVIVHNLTYKKVLLVLRSIHSP